MDGPDNPHRGGPALVGANWYRFRSGEHIHHAHVESVSFVWVVQGSGVITSLGESFAITTNSILRLPWRHDVDYRPSSQSPFHLGTIHIVPWHDFAVPVEPRVGVYDGDALLGVPWRRALASGERPVMISSRSTKGRAVISLASYGVERFLSGRTVELAMRSLGVLIANESGGWTSSEPLASGVPALLELMTDHILAHIDRHLTVGEVAAAAGCSPATAERLFSKYTGASVGAWSRGRRMQEAALLLRTSGLRINEVARRVGYEDPLYFSRVFAAEHDVPPSRYATGQLRP
jgi:AraC-like DNA-binding protein